MSTSERKDKPVPRYIKTIGAMMGGVMEAVCLQPLDVLKTRLQLAGKSATLLSVAVDMLKNEGPRSFYKGLTPFCTHLVTKYSVRWYFNEFYRSLLADKQTGKVSLAGTYTAGFGSGLTEAVLIVTPFEVIKTRLQKQKGLDKSLFKYKGPLHCAKTIFREEGVLALWKGNVPTMLRQGINQLFLFGPYDTLKYKLYGLQRDQVATSSQAFTLGLIAGSLGPFFNNPIDVCKTRLMAQETPKSAEAHVKPKYTGTLQCIATIYREEGVRSLMRGCMMRIARVAPGMAITFTVIEKVTDYAKKWDLY